LIGCAVRTGRDKSLRAFLPSLRRGGAIGPYNGRWYHFSMRRVRVRLCTWLIIGCVLFMQLAVAVYACTTDPGSQPAGATVETSQPDPCNSPHGHPLSNVCEQHCLQAAQSLQTARYTRPTPLVGVCIAVLEHTEAYAPTKAARAKAVTVRALGPPPLVRFGVLRL